MSNLDVCRFGILTASDRAAKGIYEDKSGPEIENFLKEVLTSPWEIYRSLTADKKEDINGRIIRFIN